MSSPYTGTLNIAIFGNEWRSFVIHSPFVNDDFFATSHNYPQIEHPDNYKVEVKTGNLNHISSDCGKRLVHFLYTNEYNISNDANAPDNAPSPEEIFSHNISNLFAAEMCNLSKLEELVRVEIDKLKSTLNIFKSIELVDSVLNTNEIKERQAETAKSREWLSAHLKNQLKVAFNENENIFAGFNLSDYVGKTPLLEEMGSEMLKIMHDQISDVKTSLSQLKENEKNTKMVLGESMTRKEVMEMKQMMIEMIESAKKQMLIENTKESSCKVSQEIDKGMDENVSLKNNYNEESEKHTLDHEQDQMSEKHFIPQDSDDGSAVIV